MVVYLHFQSNDLKVSKKKEIHQEKKMEELHWELQKWKSQIQFIQDEMLFIEGLLKSYVFEPRTPNLFERLEIFKQKFLKSKKEKESLKRLISKHENKMGGILECTSAICDLAYYKKHVKLDLKVTQHFDDYLKLKAEVYNYAGAVLKRKKQTF